MLKRAIELILFLVASSPFSSTSFSAEHRSGSVGESNEATFGNRGSAVFESVSKAIVRIESSPDSNAATTGVIVSEDGYVVWPGSAHHIPDLRAILGSGESIPATNLGWSTEWRIGLLKLNGNRKWPHMEWGSTSAAKLGEPCFEIGYRSKASNEDAFDQLPVVRSGKLTLVSPQHWFATDLPSTKNFEYGAGIFDDAGKLIGISVPGISLEDHVSTAVEIVTSDWQQFAAGKNLDWVRYPPSQDSPFRRLSEEESLDQTRFLPRSDAPHWKAFTKPAMVDEQAFESARKIAAATTVRIRLAGRPGKKERGSDWSGVVIRPDGLIATCAHCKQLPGDKLIVILSDNREVSAVALGTNWVSDVAVVKILDKGVWNHAEFGASSSLAPDAAVLCAGYPAPQVNPLPPVTTAILPLQQTPYVGWSHEFMFAPTLDLPGGASGGGVFSPDGKLVAIYTGPGGGHRIEMFRAQFDYLKRKRTMFRPAKK